MTAGGEHHGSMRDAVRAAQGVGNSFYKIAVKQGVLDHMPVYSEPVWRPRSQAWVSKIGFPGAGG